MVIKTINTQRVLSATQISLADYVINPYRGCEFGCLYCYSQENKNIKRDGFETFLGIKIDAPSVLKEELKTKKPKHVLLGSTTECFQYHEKKYEITEKILNILNENNISYTILTKSHLIGDYLDLIKVNKANKIYFTLNFHSDGLIKTFEANSSTLKQRLEAIKSIIKKKIKLRIHAGPFVPYISNLEKILKLLPKQIKELDIEIYHKKQGNFEKILTQVKTRLGDKIKKNLESVYKNKGNYIDFIDKLQQKIKNTGTLNKIKTFLVAPDFDKYYDSTIKYEKPFF